MPGVMKASKKPAASSPVKKTMKKGPKERVNEQLEKTMHQEHCVVVKVHIAKRELTARVL